MRYFFNILFLIFFSAPVFSITLNDDGKISATTVSHIVHVKSEADIFQAIHEAISKHIPISIMGKQYSQGGQTLAQNAIALDMLDFNKIVEVNLTKKQVTVQSGITWNNLQKIINQYNLSILSMQSPNIFTVGGSLSVNAHGDDFRAGSVGNSIVAFHIILSNGEKFYVTPYQHSDLWKAVIGGYGLLGVVTDVTLQLTDNNYYLGHYEERNLENFTDYFEKKIFNDKKTIFFYAHLNIHLGSDFLKTLYVITYQNLNDIPKTIVPLIDTEKWNPLLIPLFNMSRHGNTGKKIRWNLEKIIFGKYYNNRLVTRNNAMEKPVKFAADYSSPYSADWLQEYFIPINKLQAFIETLKNITLKNNVNLLNLTVRYVPAENNSVLSYAKQNCFAVVLYFNQPLSKEEIEKSGAWTRKLIDSSISLGGSYYLPYQLFATKAQFQKSYPNYKKFINLKNKYNPNKLFVNKFYLKYLAQ